MTKPLTTLPKASVDFHKFEQLIGYVFKDKVILQEAFTHKSYAHEKALLKEVFSHNERLEFLGDAVLDLAVSQCLMMHDFQASEGDLSKRRASLVNEVSLAALASTISLGDFLVLGKGEELSGGRTKNSILSSAFEAVFGAVFLDAGYGPAYELASKLFGSLVAAQGQGAQPFAQDYKTRLQETIQARFKVAPQYRIESSSGPEHRKTFVVALIVKDEKICEGEGSSKKEAEQVAAQRALEEFYK